MNSSPPPFDPSKPFTTEGPAPPAFDPSKPFTDASDSAMPTESHFQPWGEMPIDRAMRGVARAVVPPIANFVDYPVRALGADVYGLVKGGAPTDDKSREQFYGAREKALEATKISETKGGEVISGALAIPGQIVGGAIKKASEATLGSEATKALGPAAVMAGDVGSAALVGRAALRNPGAPPPVRQAAVEARHAGYVLPPAAISDKPGLVANVLAGWGGKIKTQQAASEHNQGITNSLAAQDLGLPPDTHLSDAAFAQVRQRAGQAYAAVASSVPVITADSTYSQIVAALGGKSGQAAQMFPKITHNQGIHDLVDELKSVPQMPTPVAMEIVRELRYNANENFKAMGDPSRTALGFAQRQAADAIDDLMERNISAVGRPDAVAQYRQARQLIAKSYDVEGATNPATGDVSARHIGALAVKGRPLSGNLDTIANSALAFPKAMQAPAGFGYDQPWSALDAFAIGGAILAGRPDAALSLGTRPLARHAVLSERMQDRITNPPSPTRAARVLGIESLQPRSDSSLVNRVLGN